MSKQCAFVLTSNCILFFDSLNLNHLLSFIGTASYHKVIHYTIKCENELDGQFSDVGTDILHFWHLTELPDISKVSMAHERCCSISSISSNEGSSNGSFNTLVLICI
jgi:hypothetical protein